MTDSNLKTTGLDSVDLQGRTPSNVSSEKPNRRQKQSTAQTTIGDDNDEEVNSFFHGSEAGQEEADNNKGHQSEGPLTWGRGVRKDWNSTTGAHWWMEMTNFHQKTIPVTL